MKYNERLESFFKEYPAIKLACKFKERLCARAIKEEDSERRTMQGVHKAVR